MISFTVQLEEKDYSECFVFEATKKLNSQTRPQKIRGKMLGSFIAGLPIFILVGFVKGWPAAAGHFSIFLGVMFLLSLRNTGVKINRMYRAVLERRAREFVRNPANEQYLAATSYSFDDGGIALASATGTNAIGWNSITCMDETASLILLDSDGDSGLIIPKRFIPDMPAFRTLLAKQLSFHAELGNKIII